MKHHILIFLTLLAVGFGAGCVNGLLGAGGGILIVFALRRLLAGRRADPRSAYVCAVATILPLSLISAVRYLRQGNIDLKAAAILILPAAIGGCLGAFLLRKLSPTVLSRLFAAVVLTSGITMLL